MYALLRVAPGEPPWNPPHGQRNAETWTDGARNVEPGARNGAEIAQPRCYAGLVTTLDLRTIKLRSGERFHDAREVALEPLELGGQRYDPVPERPETAVTVSRVSSGFLFELEFEARLLGPCFRCLGDAGVTTSIRAREYQATSPGEADELRTPYLADDVLDLSAWARDAVALALPDKILCRRDCAGLCPTCGTDLNVDECTCGPPEPDSRWAALADLRERL